MGLCHACRGGVLHRPFTSAAVAYVAPSNLITLLDAIPPYWEAGRKQMYTRMGDPTDRARQSLVDRGVAADPGQGDRTHAVGGTRAKNDPRVNVRESDQIVAAVRDNGKPVKYIVAPE